jgi:uncharacterized protein involved in exopolysaccharide biosynthesis
MRLAESAFGRDMHGKGQKPSSSPRPHTHDSGPRGDSPSDDRPFAEIRRVVHDGLRLFALHRWMFFVPFCLVSCGAFIASFYIPRTYEAATSFEVRNDPVMINLPISAGAASYKYFRNTMVRDLTAADAMGEVVENLGLADPLERGPDGELTPEAQRRRDSQARSLGAKLSITLSSPSELMDVVKITYTGDDPKLGRRLVDEVKRTYIRRTGVWLREFLVQQRDYFKREADDAAGEVLVAQREETRLRLENPHVNPADPGSISVRLSQLEGERRDLLLRRREYEAELSAQKQFLLSSDEATMSPVISVDPAAAPVSANVLALAAQIQELDRRVLELRQTRGMTDQHPEIQELFSKREYLGHALQREQSQRESAAALPAAGAFGPGPAPPGVGPALGVEHARVSLQIAAQADKIREIDIALQTNQLAIDQLQKAKDQVFEKQEEFAGVLANVQKAKARQSQVEATLAQIEPAIKAVEQNRLLHFSEGSPAHGGTVPVSPKAVTVVLLAIAAGIAAGVLFIVLAEILDHVYRSSTQVARSLGLPLLEAIDEIVTAHDRRRMLVLHAFVTPLLVLFCLGTTGLTGSIAYLSLAQPHVYERVRHIPDSVLKLFIDAREADAKGVPSDLLGEAQPIS